MIYEDFLPFVAPSAPSCPGATLQHHIRLAAIDFCRSAPVWVETLDSVTADGTTSEFALNVDDEADVVRIEEVTTASTVYELVSADEGRERIRCEDSRPSAFTINRADLTLHPTPADGDVISVVARLAPSLASSEFPDDVFAQYAQKIACGALATLLALPNCDWTNAGEADRQRALFEIAKADAIIAAGRGYSNKRLRVKASFF